MLSSMPPPSADPVKRISRVDGKSVVERRNFEGESHPSLQGILPDASYHPAAYAFSDPTEDLVVRRCRFAMFQHPTQRSVEERPTLRRLTIERCHFTASDLGPVILEDALLDTLWFHRGMWGPQKIVGCAFNRVVVRGRINGSVRFVPSIDWFLHHVLEPAVDDPFVRENERYYERVDWALDISAAEFTGIEMSWCDIPARLIRRDPETQVVITRESVRRGDWRAACGGSSAWVAIERFLATGFADTVLVAPIRSKYLGEDVAAFRRLRDVGVALAD
jgi:hypothetical protein